MKSANELKAIAIAEINRRKAECHGRVIDYLENHVAPAMEKAAAEGYMSIDFEVDTYVDMVLLREKLTAGGYSCYKKDKESRNLTIYW